jgi:CRISPR/Cas system-associated endonuclease Cas1
MKLDIKSWIIIVLFITLGIFIYKWLNSEDRYLREENKRLSDQVDAIQVERDSLSVARKLSEAKYDSIQHVVDAEMIKIKKLDQDLLRSKSDLSIAKIDLSKEKHKVDEVNAQIKQLKKTPIKREGADLLNSLRKKLK